MAETIPIPDDTNFETPDQSSPAFEQIAELIPELLEDPELETPDIVLDIDIPDPVNTNIGKPISGKVFGNGREKTPL